MEDIAFKYPKKILQIVFMGAMLVAISWGVLTWNLQNAINLWTKEVTFITKPIFNFYVSRMENRAEKLIKPYIENDRSNREELK